MSPPDLLLREERILAGEGECELFLRGKRLLHNACPKGSTLSVTVRIPRHLGTTHLTLVLRDDGKERMRLPMRFCGIQGGRDVFRGSLRPPGCGLFFYRFYAEGALGSFWCLHAGGGKLFFSRKEAEGCLPLSVTEFAHPAPRWLFGGIIYHIFVDRFFRVGDPPAREGCFMHPVWEDGVPHYPSYPGGPLLCNDFFGGTLDGVTEKLSDLVALGVNCLYLSPIQEASSNHRYDTGNYERIDPMLGGEEAFFRLLSEAHRRGIRVVLDGVFNHTGSDSLYFNKAGRYPSLGAYQSEESPYYGWYTFREHPDRYDCWWGIDTLPRLNHADRTLREYLLGEGGIVARYARAGIGGFRLDVADELEDSFLEALSDRLKALTPDAVLIGEVWEDAALKISYGKRRRYYLGRELDGVMNYPLRTGLITYFRSGDVAPLRYALKAVLANMPPRIAAGTMNLLGTHDTVRALTALVGADPSGYTTAELAAMTLPPEEYRRGRELLIIAYLALATLPGVPSVFYGDEVGMQGYGDPLNRRPYPWHRRDRTLLAAYRRIGRMRRREPVYREGEMRLLHLTSSLLIFSRSAGRRTVITVINRSAGGLRLCFDRAVRELLFGRRERRFLLGARSGGVYRTVRGARLTIRTDRGEVILPDGQ